VICTNKLQSCSLHNILNCSFTSSFLGPHFHEQSVFKPL